MHPYTLYALIFIAPTLVLLPFVWLERRKRAKEREMFVQEQDEYLDEIIRNGLRELNSRGELDRELSGDDL